MCTWVETFLIYMCNIHVTVWYRYMHRMTYVYDDIGQVCRISIIYLYSILQIRRQTSKKTSEAGTSYLSEAHEFTIAFIGAHFAQVAVLCVVFCRSLFVLLSFFFWPLYSMPDLSIDSIGWSLGPQNLGGLLPRCILFLTLLLQFHIYAVITYCTF